jgi:hypothetical protein
MADGTSIGKLVVELTADSRGLTTATRSAQTSLNDLGKTVSGLSAIFKTYIGAAVIAQLARFTVESIRATATLSRMAQEAGITTEQLQRLSFAFRDTSVNQEQLAQATITFARNLAELNSGTGQFLSFLRNSAPALIQQFKGITDVNQAFDALAGVLNTMPNKFDQQRLATAALGEAGAKLTNELEKGAEAFRKTKESATNVISEDLIQKSRELDVKFKELTETLGNFAQRAAVAAATAFGLVSMSASDLRKEIDKQYASIQLTNRGISELNAKGKDTKVLNEALAKQIANLNALQQQEADLINKTAVAIGTVTGARTLDNDAIAKAQLRLQEYLDRMQGIPILFDQSGLAGELFAERMIRSQELVRASTEKTYEVQFKLAQMRLQLQRSEQEAILQTAGVAAQALTTLFPKSKAAAIAAAVINTAVSITRALSEVPWPWGVVQAALYAAMGAAQIAAIRSTSLSGGGGTPSASAGTGGAAAAPAEAPQARSLHIQGIDRAALFSGAQLEQLIVAINQEVQNGATLISTRNIPT